MNMDDDELERALLGLPLEEPPDGLRASILLATAYRPAPAFSVAEARRARLACRRRRLAYLAGRIWAAARSSFTRSRRSARACRAPCRTARSSRGWPRAARPRSG